MKNINKKLVFVAIFALVLSVVFGANTALAAAPTISGVAASNITQTTADLSATITANGMPTAAWFDTSGGACTSNCGNAGGINPSQVITYTMTGLTANTSYSFTVNAFNGSGFATPVTINFITASAPAPVAPSLSAVSASGVTTTSATLNGTVNPNGTPTAAWFDTSGGNCTSACGNTGGINSTQTITYNLTGLTPNTSYSFQMFAMNSGGPTQSATINFTTAPVVGPAAPILSAVSASAITTTSATLNGTVNPNGSATAAWFDTSGGNCTSNCGNVGGINSTQNLTYVLTGLTPNTSYSFQMLALNSGGPASSSTVNFTTSSVVVPGAPIMTTVAASGITKTSADLNGTWDAQGFSTTTHFEYGTTAGLGTSSANVVQGLGNGNMTFNLTGLSSNTTYFFRAVGVNTNGTTNGTILSFNTLSSGGGGGGGGGSSTPSVTTKDASNIGASVATLNGYVSPKGTSSRWFEYGTNQNNLSLKTDSVNVTISGDVNDIISGLSANTTYYFRIVALNMKHQNFATGQILSFKTTGGNPLKVTTSLASTVGQTTARINGLVLSAEAGSQVWFEYGRTTALGYSTDVKSVSGASTNVSNVLGNLAPDIIYFYRIVAKNSIGTIKGEIKIFKTLSSSVAPVVIDEDENTESLISIKLEATPTTVAPLDEMNFTATYKNTSNKQLEDVVVRVVLPDDIEFAASSRGDYDAENRTLSANVGSLEAGEEGILTLSGVVSENAVDQDVLVVTASVVYTDGEAQGDALDYALIDVAVNPNLLPAASIFGSGFLPSTLLGWMVLILVALGLVMVGRKFYGEVNWATVTAKIGSAFRKDEPPTNLPR